MKHIEKLQERMPHKQPYKGMTPDVRFLMNKINQLITFSHELVEYLRTERGGKRQVVFDMGWTEEEWEKQLKKNESIIPSPEAPQEKECIHWDCTRRLDWTCKVCYPTPQEKCTCGDAGEYCPIQEKEHGARCEYNIMGDPAMCDCAVSSPTPESEVDVKYLLEDYAGCRREVDKCTLAGCKTCVADEKRMSEIEEIINRAIHKN